MITKRGLGDNPAFVAGFSIACIELVMFCGLGGAWLFGGYVPRVVIILGGLFGGISIGLLLCGLLFAWMDD